MRQRIARDTDGKLAIGRDLDDALVPAVGFLDGLVNRQCVNELVGDDDDGAARNVVERGVPQDRHAGSFQPPPLHLAQLRVDLDQVEHHSGAEVLDDLHRPHRVGHECPASGP